MARTPVPLEGRTNIGPFANAVTGVTQSGGGLGLSFANGKSSTVALPSAGPLTLAGNTLGLLYSNGGSSSVTLPFANAVTGVTQSGSGLGVSFANGKSSTVTLPSTGPLTLAGNTLGLLYSNGGSSSVTLPFANAVVSVLPVTGGIQATYANGVVASVAVSGGSSLSYFTAGDNSSQYYVNNPSGSAVLCLGSTGSLSVTGDISAFDVITLSDARLKSNVAPVRDALSRLERIRGLTYTMGGRRKAGVIAQEVQEVLPEAVEETDQGMLAVTYNALSSLYVEAFREVSRRLERVEEILGLQL